MPQYAVEVHGDAREVYIVEADSESDAMARWHEGGQPVLTEVSGSEPISARLEEA